MCDDKNCQSTKCQKQQVSVCDDKNCQSTKPIHMWPMKSAMTSSHMQSVQPAMTQSTYKCSQVRSVSLCDDKNGQSTKKHSYEEYQVGPMYDDSNC